MWLVDEAEMVAKKKYNEGRIDLKTLNEFLGRDPDADEDEKIESDDRNFNLLFTGAVKEDLLKTIRPYQKINHFPFSYNVG